MIFFYAVVLLNQELINGGDETVLTGYISGINQILVLYKLNKATQISDSFIHLFI